MILWLGEMSRLFHFCPETSALGVCVLNRLLSTVKVKARTELSYLGERSTPAKLVKSTRFNGHPGDALPPVFRSGN